VPHALYAAPMTESAVVNIAILAPSPVPLQIGGAENLWWGLLDHLNRQTEHHADLVKLPTPERDFWEIVDSYRRWSELDVSGYDAVISGKYPAWMPQHPRHLVYLLHPLRGLYDTYPQDWPKHCDIDHPQLRGLLELLRTPRPGRDALDECFARLDAIRGRSDLAPELFALPAPFIREVVHFLDRVGRGPDAIARSVAMSATVAHRADYFSEPDAVAVAYPPTRLQGLHEGRGRHLFTVSRLDHPKRIDLIIRAMAHVRSRVPLRIAGTGPQDAALRALAAGDARIRFDGFLNESELVAAYASAIAVPFVPDREDYGYVTLEAMLSAKPVITVADAGGPTELVKSGVTGLVTEPDPKALGGAIEALAGRRRLARRMGRAGSERARDINWHRVVSALLDGVAI
jgi:glycosyltransferase involved in cell wall biosynthesis